MQCKCLLSVIVYLDWKMLITYTFYTCTAHRILCLQVISFPHPYLDSSSISVLGGIYIISIYKYQHQQDNYASFRLSCSIMIHVCLTVVKSSICFLTACNLTVAGEGDVMRLHLSCDQPFHLFSLALFLPQPFNGTDSHA